MEAIVEKVNVLKEISNMLKSLASLDESSSKNCVVKNKIYGISLNGSNLYFDKKSDLSKCIKNNNLDKRDFFCIEYIGEQGNCDNVIRIICGDTINLYNIIDEKTYFVFDREASLQKETPIWNLRFGNITEYYQVLNRMNDKVLERKMV